MRTSAIALSLLCIWTSTAWAKGPKKVAVMDIPPDATFPTNVTQILNDFLAGAIRDQGFTAVTSGDIAAALGLDKQKQLLGCSESSCMAEIGGALGADYIVRGEVAALESSTAVTLSLLDVSGHTLGQVREIAKGKTSEVLLAAIERMVPRLMASVKPKSDVALVALAPQVSAPAPSHGHAAAYSLLGVGGAGLAASVLFGVLASSKQGSVNDAFSHGGPINPDDANALKRDAAISTATLGVGLVAAGVGAALLIFGGSGSESTAASTGPVALRF